MPVKFQTLKKNVNLAEGETLHFQTGKGYYAGPATKTAPVRAVPPPTGYAPGGVTYKPPRVVTARKGVPGATPPDVGLNPPPRPPTNDPYAALSYEELERRANELAQAGLTPQQDEIRRQQARSALSARQDEAAIRGFQTAAGELLGAIPGEVGAGYRAAAATEGEIGKGIGGAIGQDLSAKAAAEDEFARSQGQTGGRTYDPNATAATVSVLGGVLPGDSLAEEGAARQEEAARNVAIPLNAGREELAARMARAREEDDQYAQQLIALAAQFPGLKAQALQQLNQYEVDKAQYRESVRVNTANIAGQKADRAEARRVDTSNIANAKADNARQERALRLQERAERANEKAAGVAADVRKGELAYRWASLEFQSQKAVAAAKKAASQGKRIDVATSRLLGHIVYKDGTEDASIKVKQTTGTKTDPAVKAKYNRAKATQSARTDAYKYATTLLGKPQAVDARTAAAIRAVTPSRVGKYVAASGEKTHGPGAVFPPAYPGAPATTNNPARAARIGGGASDYADAQAKVWAEIGGDSLMSRFGYSREQVMAIVNRALTAAGWRPGR